jgi:diaminohydroxyphosphoribosylaminopyrimidine deaminase / 5-amino-6-(5-phosphoribosylamino)uracil reductase
VGESGRRAGTAVVAAGEERSVEVLGGEDAWSLVLALRDRVRRVGPIVAATGLQLRDGILVEGPEHAWVVVDPDEDGGWRRPRAGGRSIDDAATQILDLYIPLCTGPAAADLVAAHLAQSLDGRVATKNGVSQFISHQADLVHTHRMRALFDAVVVGAHTVELDDPQLTTRHVRGENPVRVVLDPRGRLGAHHRVFVDAAARTVLVRAPGSPAIESDQVTLLDLAVRDDGCLPLSELREALARLGLRRLFVEGGGVTVSGFLRANVLDRLHVTVAPVILGSGRPGFTLPEISDLEGALRIAACRHHVLGPDILFDCALASSSMPRSD